MNIRTKAIICAAPLLVAGYVWFSMAAPAVTQQGEVSTALAEKQKEQIGLKSQAFEVTKIGMERATLEKEVEALRRAVPNSPDTDLLVIDLDRMCGDSGMDLVSIAPATDEKTKALEESEQMEALSEVRNKYASGGLLGKAKSLGDVTKTLKDKADETKDGAKADADKDKDGKDGKPSNKIDTGLEKKVFQVAVTGDFPGFIELIRKLEDYQRVIDINGIDVSLTGEDDSGSAKGSKSSGEETGPDPKHLKISFLLTAYYLP